MSFIFSSQRGEITTVLYQGREKQSSSSVPYLQILWVRFFFFLNCYNFISFMRKTVFCDQIAFCILFIQCLGVFVAVEVEINAEILIYCVKFFIWIYSSVDYFKWEKWFGVATVFSRSRELLQQLQKKKGKVLLLENLLELIFCVCS